MMSRLALSLVGFAAVAVPSLAAAADLAQYPVLVPEPVAPECSRYGATRGYDDVWQPPQSAYIVAANCGPSIDMVNLLTFNRREKILVYYNGGSMYKTDIDLLVVPK